MRVLALDPGGTTGWAYYDSEEDNEGSAGSEWQRGHLVGNPHHHALWELLCTMQPEVLIYERFMYQRRELDKGVSLNTDAHEYIGICKLFIGVGNLVPCTLVEQSPHQRKIWTDDKLKALGLWIPGLSHAMDATRHLFYYLVVTLGKRELIEGLRPNLASEVAENEGDQNQDDQ